MVPKRRVRRKWWSVLSGIGVVAFAVFLGSIRIQTVEVTGAGVLVPNAAIRDAVQNVLQERRWGIFPRSRAVFVGSRALERQLQTQFALGSVRVTRGWRGGALHVVVAEQSVVGVASFDDGVAVMLSVSGVSFGELPEQLRTSLSTGDRPLVPVIRLGGTPTALGQQVLTPEAIALLSGAWGILREGNVLAEPSYVTRVSGSRTSFDLVTVRGVRVSLSAEDTPTTQLEKLRTLLTEPTFAAKAANVRSVDVRYGDRVYVQ